LRAGDGSDLQDRHCAGGVGAAAAASHEHLAHADGAAVPHRAPHDVHHAAVALRHEQASPERLGLGEAHAAKGLDRAAADREVKIDLHERLVTHHVHGDQPLGRSLAAG
jgi:hypothetical protein